MVLGICRRWLDDPHAVDDAFQAVFLILFERPPRCEIGTVSRAGYTASPCESRTAARYQRHATAQPRRQDAEGLAMARTPEHVPADRETLLILDEENPPPPRKTTSRGRAAPRPGQNTRSRRGRAELSAGEP